MSAFIKRERGNENVRSLNDVCLFLFAVLESFEKQRKVRSSIRFDSIRSEMWKWTS